MFKKTYTILYQKYNLLLNNYVYRIRNFIQLMDDNN